MPREQYVECGRHHPLPQDLRVQRGAKGEWPRLLGREDVNHGVGDSYALWVMLDLSRNPHMGPLWNQLCRKEP